MENPANEFKFEELSDEAKKILLSAFGYEVNEEGHIIDVLLKDRVISKNTREPLTIKNAALLPGSLKVVDSDPLTISRYIREELENESKSG